MEEYLHPGSSNCPDSLVGILKFSIQLFKLGSEKSPGFAKRITKDENTFYR